LRTTDNPADQASQGGQEKRRRRSPTQNTSNIVTFVELYAAKLGCDASSPMGSARGLGG